MSLRHVLICASVVLVFGAGFASSYAENSSTNHTIAGGRTLAAPITVTSQTTNGNGTENCYD